MIVNRHIRLNFWYMIIIMPRQIVDMNLIPKISDIYYMKYVMYDYYKNY